MEESLFPVMAGDGIAHPFTVLSSITQSVSHVQGANRDQAAQTRAAVVHVHYQSTTAYPSLCGGGGMTW